jgi:hypothetical protein
MNNWVIICILLVVLVVATITEKPRILEGLTGRGRGHGGGIRYVGGGGGGYEVNPILFGYPYYYGYYYYPYYLFFTDASD